MNIFIIFGRFIKPLFNLGLGQIMFIHYLYKWMWRYFGPKGIKLTKIDEYNMYVICRDWAVAPALLFTHTWEQEETKIFREHIKEGMTVIDAGAYIGYFSLLASRLVGVNGKVYSFEPSPETVEVLRKNRDINNCKNIVVIDKAISDKDGRTSYYVSPQNPSGSSMYENYAMPGHHIPSIGVETVTLDSEFDGNKIDFIKMDIEGGETAAIKGMKNIIKNNPELKMMVEVNPIGFVKVGTILEDFIDLLEQDFRLYMLEDTTQEVGLPEIHIALQEIAVINLFCVNKGKYA